MEGFDPVKLSSIFMNLSVGGCFLIALLGVMTRKWVPGIYYTELQEYANELKAHIAKLETNL